MPNRSERGASALVVLIAILALLALFVGCGAMTYNGMATKRESVTAKWSEIDNQYKRRFDMVPQLVETVKGAVDFEKSTLESVVQARASVAKVNLPSDPQAIEAYLKAQKELGNTLGRLFAVAESYPELKASQNFLSLQDQLEGTENRIAVARRDYIDSVREYNTALATFPGNFIGSMFGFQKSAQLSIEEKEREIPKIDFGGKK